MFEPDVAIVTGSGRGIGTAVVAFPASQERRVVVSDIGAGRGKQSSVPSVAAAVADDTREPGGEAIWNSQGPHGPTGVHAQPVRRVLPRYRRHPFPPSRRAAAFGMQAHAVDGRDAMACSDPVPRSSAR